MMLPVLETGRAGQSWGAPREAGDDEVLSPGRECPSRASNFRLANAGGDGILCFGVGRTNQPNQPRPEQQETP
jgi:hypothetical protein